MNVLLMTPYQLYRRWPTTPYTSKMIVSAAPVTLAQLAGCIPGHNVRVFDGNVYEPPIAKFVELVRWADVIGMNVMSSYAALNTEMNILFIKLVAPGRPIVLGGHHATFYANEWLARGADYIVRREGELSFTELVSALARGCSTKDIEGLSFLYDGEPHHNPDRPFIEDLDSLPIPRWELLDFSRYKSFIRGKGAAACIETSRGCSHHCLFCQVGPMWKHRRRTKSPHRVLKELKKLHSIGIQQLFITDDDFGDPDDAPRQHEIFSAWERSRLDFVWGCFMRADYILRHPETIERAARLGLRYAFVGFETVSKQWLQRYNKNLGVEGEILDAYREAYRIMRKSNVLVLGFLLVGYPHQTAEDMMESLSEWRTFCDYPVVNFFKPLKGTVGYNICAKNGLLAKDTFYDDSQAASIHGVERMIPEYNRFFMKILMHPRRFLGIFAARKLERDMHRAINSWFGRGVLNPTYDSLIDWLEMKTRDETPQAMIDRLTKKYLDPLFIERLARPFLPPSVRS